MAQDWKENRPALLILIRRLPKVLADLVVGPTFFHYSKPFPWLRGRHGFDMHGRRVKAHVRGGNVTRLLKACQRLFGNEYALAA
jgi:hypothetical protein